MTYRKAKWFIYTVLVGMLPFIARCFVFLIMKQKQVASLINEADFVAFGLVLHITNVNELEHIKLEDKSWKTIHNGVSITFIAIYSVIFSISVISSINATLFDAWIMKISSILLSFASVIFSYAIYDRLDKLHQIETKNE